MEKLTKAIEDREIIGADVSDLEQQMEELQLEEEQLKEKENKLNKQVRTQIVYYVTSKSSRSFTSNVEIDASVKRVRQLYGM